MYTHGMCVHVCVGVCVCVCVHAWYVCACVWGEGDGHAWHVRVYLSSSCGVVVVRDWK